MDEDRITPFRVDTPHGPIGGVEVGDPGQPAALLLHGWPQTSHAWRRVMRLAAPHAHLVAPDWPGVGASPDASSDGTTADLAAVAHEVVEALGLDDPVIVGHDLGGMVAYPYLRAHDVGAAVILDVVVPGIEPWNAIWANPWVWHFRFHGIPHLPEAMVAGRERTYFDWFFDAISPEENTISDAARATYAAAYSKPAALSAGFDWYRALPGDAEAHQALGEAPCSTRLAYARGEHEGGDVEDYVRGFRDVGLTDVTGTVLPGAGHFGPEDAPAVVWDLIRDRLRA